MQTRLVSLKYRSLRKAKQGGQNYPKTGVNFSWKSPLKEGKEVLITVKEPDSEDRFLKAAGGWKGTIDCEKLIKDIYEDRLLKTRPETKP